MAQTKMNKTVVRAIAGLHGGMYKVSGGRLGSKVRGGNVIILGTTGRKSGKHRERPLIAGDHPDGWVVIASFSGHGELPAWYLNLVADPEASVKIGNETHPVHALVAEGEERATLWQQMADIYSDYEEYQAVTDREIPVVVLERTEAS